MTSNSALADELERIATMGSSLTRSQRQELMQAAAALREQPDLAAFRERCATIANNYPETEDGKKHHSFTVCWNVSGEIAAAIRALPLPAPPTEQKGETR